VPVATPGGEATGPYQPAESRKPKSSPPGFADQARFTPGQLLADRYRIVALLGKGGMGEVYRADDLKLGQSVALKFLPPELVQDPERLARFHGEVRIARQISHPNVCRVYDIAEWRPEGREAPEFFLTMEHIDGEDLATLLKKVGRLPEERGVEIARQLCLGLAAAHERGVLHRDLKPANIMIDGRGHVRILDFGLAVAAEEAVDARSGTPAYQAPEQLAGQEVTVRSDLYSLGLVLYEVFTGKTAFLAATRQELLQQRQQGTPTPSSRVSGLNPAVERVILRCLEVQPARRPRSAVEVAAALPGGDPLAAALAAGETPSPEMVAAAGQTGGLRPAIGLACLAAVVLGLLFHTWESSQYGIEAVSHLNTEPAVLKAEGLKLLQTCGWYDAANPPTDLVYGFRYRQGTELEFWLRLSPHYLLPAERPPYRGANHPWGLYLTDPPPFQEGMVSLRLSAQGQLRELLAVPPHEAGTGRHQEPNWAPLFAAAGLGYEAFRDHRTKPKWAPPVPGAVPVAWEGSGSEGQTVRVEAAGYGGKPVYFQVCDSASTGPETLPSRTEPQIRQLAQLENRASEVGKTLGLLVFMVPLLVSAFLARRNWRLGRTDRQGAFQYGVAIAGLSLLLWLFETRHLPDLGYELHLFASGFYRSLLMGFISWLYYLALEPYVRRFWPDTLITWSRVQSGRFLDPLVGRDILIGATASVLVLALFSGMQLGSQLLGNPLPPSTSLAPESLLGGRHVIARILWFKFILEMSVPLLMTIVLLRLLLRNAWLAVGAFVVLWTLIVGLGNPLWTSWVILALYFLLHAVLLTRFGLVAFLAGIYGYHLLIRLPVTANLSAWYSGAGLVAVTVVVGLAVFGFWTSLGGRPLLGKGFFGDE
jgi:serine/threonine-protein kinase